LSGENNTFIFREIQSELFDFMDHGHGMIILGTHDSEQAGFSRHNPKLNIYVKFKSKRCDDLNQADFHVPGIPETWKRNFFSVAPMVG
jgi:hypothetical protein